jgi:hypothetical protein
MAAYLASVGSDARAVQQRRPPTLGAGQAASPTESGARGGDQGRPSETQAALPGAAPGRRTPGATEPAQSAGMKPRRPSESVETGRLPVAEGEGGAEAAPPQTATAGPARPHAAEDFEE